MDKATGDCDDDSMDKAIGGGDKKDDSMDSDELFAEFIEVDPGFIESDHSDKENTEKRLKTGKAKKNQFEKLTAFTKQYDESSLEKEKFKKLWSILTNELNSLGPPIFTADQWKKKWSQHKYNMKRKRTANTTEIPGKSCQDNQSLNRNIVSSLTHETFDDRSKILEKLVVIIDKEDVIAQKLDKNNEILQEIAQSLVKLCQAKET